MVVNDNAGYLIPRGGLAFFASMLAPTEVVANPGKWWMPGLSESAVFAQDGGPYRTRNLYPEPLHATNFYPPTLDRYA